MNSSSQSITVNAGFLSPPAVPDPVIKLQLIASVLFIAFVT
jgi:hypothetical protein